MKRTVLLLLFITASTQMAISQDDFIRGSLGLTRSNVQVGGPDFQNLSDKFKSGFLIQVTYNHPFNQNLYWGAGLGFYTKGYKEGITFFDNNAQPDFDDYITWGSDYIGTPIYLGLRKNHSSLFFAELGIVPSILTKVTFKSFDQDTQTERKVTITDIYDDFNLVVFSTIGLRKELNDGYEIDLSISAQQSLTGVGFEDFSTGNDRFHLALSVMAGVVYRLDN